MSRDTRNELPVGSEPCPKGLIRKLANDLTQRQGRRIVIQVALIALVVISGAIFFHLFTPLGVVRTVDAMGNTDGGVLFFMACGVWVASAILLFMHRAELPFLASSPGSPNSA